MHNPRCSRSNHAYAMSFVADQVSALEAANDTLNRSTATTARNLSPAAPLCEKRLSISVLAARRFIDASARHVWKYQAENKPTHLLVLDAACRAIAHLGVLALTGSGCGDGHLAFSVRSGGGRKRRRMMRRGNE